ncbi:hypothetical protein ACFWG0_15880 [Streptomyces yangpuensis]|uniref:hypothetical protein n=1 Tax=Streptomyces yangpuensis TaxID=1648182 RepID=UPI00365F1163
MSECDRERARCEAALEGFFAVAQSWEFELAWKLCWLEKDLADAGWRGGPPDDPGRDAVREERALLTPGLGTDGLGDRGAPYSVDDAAGLSRRAGGGADAGA